MVHNLPIRVGDKMVPAAAHQPAPYTIHQHRCYIIDVCRPIVEDDETRSHRSKAEDVH